MSIIGKVLVRCEAWSLLVRVCHSLEKRPYRATRRWVAKIGAKRPRVGLHSEATDLAWAVERTSRWVPRARCLAKALATEILLARRGITSKVCFGVPIERTEDFVAHAWVVCDGKVVMGAPIEGYRELSPPGQDPGSASPTGPLAEGHRNARESFHSMSRDEGEVLMSEPAGSGDRAT